jgi:hypothetical protein
MDHSISFLNSLLLMRDESGVDVSGYFSLWNADRSSNLFSQPSRPIVFVAHSLGGILLKDVGLPISHVLYCV